MSYGARTSDAGGACYRGVVVYEDEKGEVCTSARGPYETTRPCNAFINSWVKRNLARKAPKPENYKGSWWDWDREAPNEPLRVIETYIEEPTGWQKVVK